MHPPIDQREFHTHCMFLQVDGSMRGPVRRIEETADGGLFVLDFGPVMPDEPAQIIGEARLVDQLTGQTRHVECLNISCRNDGCYYVLCADLGPDLEDAEETKFRRLDDFLLLKGRMIGGVGNVVVSTPEPENEPAFVRLTVDSESWRMLGLMRDSCAHCDAAADGPCGAVRLGRRAMRSITYPGAIAQASGEHRIELLELGFRRRCLLEPVAVTSDRFAQVRMLSRVVGVSDLKGRRLE